MNKKEISTDFIDRLTEIMNNSYKKEKSDVQDDFYEDVIYANILKEYLELPLNVEKNSLLYIFTLLSAEPKKDEKKLTDDYIYYSQQEEYKKITNYNHFLTQNIFNMLQFINISTYLYQYYLQNNPKDEQKNFLLILITSASNMYEELYSSRGKIEFAYYFKKVLENNTQINTKITPYNRESWRGDYARYTKAVKSMIDSLKEEDVIYISNIVFIYGRRQDERLPHKGECYIIEAGIHNNSKEYERISIATFL